MEKYLRCIMESIFRINMNKEFVIKYWEKAASIMLWVEEYAARLRGAF